MQLRLLPQLHLFLNANPLYNEDCHKGGQLEQRVLKDDELVFVCDELGDIPEGRRRLGLYYRDTRYLSTFELTINGHRLRHLSSSCQRGCICESQLANPTINARDDTTILARTIGIQRTRFLSKAFNERITLYNYNQFPACIDLTLYLGSDFSDIFEVRGFQREKAGIVSEPRFQDSKLTLEYTGLDGIKRSTEFTFDISPSKVDIEKDTRLLMQRPSTFLPESTDIISSTMVRPPSARAIWNLTIEPMKSMSLTFSILPIEDQSQAEVTSFDYGLSCSCCRFEDWHDECTKIETDNELFNQLLQRSIVDLRLLLEQTTDGLVPDAGIPWFCCISGPNSLITSLQILMLNPQVAVNTLRYLARHRGTKVNPWRDEEPGKIVHEMRKGEMARTEEIPHTAYYGSIDATPLFLILFTEAMKWLDDDNLFQEILPAAKLALEWMQRYGDLDGDGYLEYLSRSTGGIQEQGWKDSRGLISYPDGTPVSSPIALAEVQGYAYMAMKEMASLLEMKGESKLARELDLKAKTLKDNFNRDFWLEEQLYFAQALDSNKEPVKNVTSSIGHCLFCDIIDEEKANYVVNRLTSSDMTSGWGIRTLSSRAPRYNPMSYRQGSIWPHDNAFIVAGMQRYGYHWEVEETTSQVFEAGAFFTYNRLPELFGGFHRNREAYSVPAEYPASCSPQAWAAGSIFLLFQSMLGLQVDAVAKRVYLSPRLPGWLRYASVQNLRVGRKTVSLYFERQMPDEETRFEISDNDAGVEVVIPPR